MVFQIPTKVDSIIFRAYDIRGIAGDSLTENVYFVLGLALGQMMKEAGENTVIVGRDGRLSSPDYAEAIMAGFSQSGISVKDIGLVPTPLMYFATHDLPYHSGVIITGSHNPKNYNGLKIVLSGQILSGDAIQALRKRVEQLCSLKEFVSSSVLGVMEEETGICESYINYVKRHIRLERPLKVVVDAGNGAASVVVKELYQRLGCEVIPLFCEVDGLFPNHHPNPGDPKNMIDLQRAVLEYEADIGLAFDGDADRLGVVDSQGNIIWPDRLLMLFARHVLLDYPGSKIIYDVKCSRHLDRMIKSWGGVPMMAKTGHSLIRRKMIEESAMLAGEISGHIFFVDQWFSFDDGLYAGVKMLEILAKTSVSSAELFLDYEDDHTTAEILQPVNEADKFELVNRLIQTAEADTESKAEIIKIDGLRLEFPDGWGLVRASNTTPCLTLRFAGETTQARDRVRSVFKAYFSLLGIPVGEWVG